MPKNASLNIKRLKERMVALKFQNTTVTSMRSIRGTGRLLLLLSDPAAIARAADGHLAAVAFVDIRGSHHAARNEDGRANDAGAEKRVASVFLQQTPDAVLFSRHFA